MNLIFTNSPTGSPGGKVKLSDITVNKWYTAARDIDTSQGKIKKNTRVRVASKQGSDVYVYFNYKAVKVNPSDLKN